MNSLFQLLAALTVVSLGLLRPEPAVAQTAQLLLSSCRPVAQAEVTEQGIRFARNFETGLCWGAFGMLQSAINLYDGRRGTVLAVCAPEESTRSQLVQVFVRFAEANPARLHEDGNQLAIESLQLAYPCVRG